MFAIGPFFRSSISTTIFGTYKEKARRGPNIRAQFFLYISVLYITFIIIIIIIITGRIVVGYICGRVNLCTCARV